VTHVVAVPVDLWSTSSLAAGILLAVAVAAVVLLSVESAPAGRAAVVVAVMGLGVAAYAAVRCFVLPDLGMDVAPAVAGPGAAVGAQTHLDGGPFLALAGALMLIAGAAGLLPDSAVAREARPAAPAV
jgi:hypothetical protein